MSRLRIALAKGRLYQPSVERFRLAGAEPEADAGRRLLIPSSDPGIEFLVVKPGDVPVYVESGAADLGVTGTDVLRESNADVLEPLELGNTIPGFGDVRSGRRQLLTLEYTRTGGPHLVNQLRAGFSRIAFNIPQIQQIIPRQKSIPRHQTWREIICALLRIKIAHRITTQRIADN